MITPSFSPTSTERVLPKLALDFTTGLLDNRVTFTRTTDATHPATYTNNSGYVTSATNNQARFDYNPVALTCKGLLIEESRSNICLQSEDFSTTWLANNATVVTNQATSPANTLTGDLVYPTSTGSFRWVYQSIAQTNGTVYTQSIYAKAAGMSWLLLSLPTADGYGLAYFDVTNGVVGAVRGGATATISNAGNGWWRCTVSYTAGASYSYMLAGPVDGNGNTTATTSGTNGVYLWGAQLEAGAFATSYIPTTSAALTRNADVAVMTGTNFSDWFNASEGTFECTFDKIGVTSGISHALWAIGNGSNTNNTIFLYVAYNGAYRTRLLGYNATTLDVDVYPTTTYLANTFVNTCFTYKANSYAGAVNAGAVTKDTAGNVPSVVNMVLGANAASAGSYLNGHIEKLNYYQQRLTDAEIQSFSKG